MVIIRYFIFASSVCFLSPCYAANKSFNTNQTNHWQVTIKQFEHIPDPIISLCHPQKGTYLAHKKTNAQNAPFYCWSITKIHPQDTKAICCAIDSNQFKHVLSKAEPHEDRLFAFDILKKWEQS